MVREGSLSHQAHPEPLPGRTLPPDAFPPFPPHLRTLPAQEVLLRRGQVEIAAHLVYELDPDGRQLRVIKFTDYTAEKVRTFWRTPADSVRWADSRERAAIIAKLAEQGIDFVELAAATGQPDADPFDLLCHVAFNAPLRTRRRARATIEERQEDFFERYGPKARPSSRSSSRSTPTMDRRSSRSPKLRGAAAESLRERDRDRPTLRWEQKLREAIEHLQTLLYAA